MADLPSAGTKIPVEKLHVSECNVRYDERFGESEEDREFVEHLKFNPIQVPMEARPEGDGFGVYIGRRRFLAKKDYTTHFTVGKDLLIFDVSEEEAREASFIENNEWLKKNMDPITYAEQLNIIASRGGGGIRATAKRLGVAPSTVSQYLKLLTLSDKMRKAVRDKLIPYMGKSGSDPHSALGLAKMVLSHERQDMLAETLLNGGKEALYGEIDKLTGVKRRGIKKDQFYVFRVTYPKTNKFTRQKAETISKAAKNRNMTEPEYIQHIIDSHMDEIEKDAKQ